MALINCPECTHKISDQSVSCTNCGFPLVKPAPFKDISPSSRELKELKLLKELEEVGEHEESGWIDTITIVTIICIGIYFMFTADDIDNINYLLQYVIGLFSR